MVDYTETRLALAMMRLLQPVCAYPVVVGPFQQVINQGVAVTPFGPVVETDDGSVLVGLNVHVRAPQGTAVTDVMDEAERVRGALVALRMTTVDDVPISEAWRDRATPVARDAAGRPERIDTYTVRTDRLGTT